MKLFKKSTVSALVLLPFFLLFGLSSCNNEKDDPGKDGDENEVENEIRTVDLTINPGVTYQTISGFGGANQMWGTTFPGASDMKKAFGTGDDELGFSIFRVRIASNTGEWANIINVCKEAQKYGAKILASPWSPPPALKNNGSDIRGHLLESNYEAYADHINAFVNFMKSNDVDIYAISIQNEPDWPATYESCDWTAVQMAYFLKTQGSKFGDMRVAGPESLNFSQSFTNYLLNDATVSEHLDIVAGHLYGGGLGAFPKAEELGKEIWMTEYLLNQNATSNWSQLSNEVIWGETLQMLESIHGSMTFNWNAYIWWYLKRYYSFIGDGTQGTTSGEILKRGYAFSHYSKFIRPGYQRIKADLAKTDLDITAYSGEGKIVVVIVNSGSSKVSNLNLLVSGESPQTITSYSTSLVKNREKEVVELTEGMILVDVLPRSVMTVVLD